MHNVRFALLCAAGIVLFFLWQAWQTDYVNQPVENVPPVAQQQQPTSTQTSADTGTDVPDFNTAPSAAAATTTAKTPPGTAATSNTEQAIPAGAGKTIHVVTDKFDVLINTHGGTLQRVALPDVAASTEHQGQALVLMQGTGPHFFIAQDGLIGKGNPPNHDDKFTAKKLQYRMVKGQKTLQVPLYWSDSQGHRVTKIYTFHRGSYEIDLRQKITNNSNTPWTVSQYVRLWREPFSFGSKAPFSHSFSGVVWYQQQDHSADYKYEKTDPEDLAENPLSTQQSGGWLGLMEHYFLAAIIPPQDARVHYFAKPKTTPAGNNEGYAAGYVSARHKIAPNSSGSIGVKLFLGPKLHKQLAAVGAPNLKLTIDYGYITIVAKPIFWVLSKIHALVGNWGLAILLLTVLIKLAFFKLSETQYKSMARMRKFGPRIKQLKEQYGDDKEKMQSKMMDLYKKEGFNPLGGCWPMLVQMPVFIALYYVLLESAELRHAPFIFWIQDLSSPDPYYILPVLFGITMYFQQKLSSSVMAMQPIQKRMMQIMPVGMAIFFALFPAGLVIYWLTSNLISIAQQWYIYRKMDHEGVGKRAGKT